MKVILTDDQRDIGTPIKPSAQSDCDCNCDCACPIDGIAPPVLPLPTAYYLELTPICNNACPVCANHDAHQGYRKPVLRTSQWETIITYLATHARHFKITGGEPTLHPDFEEIIGLIQDTGIHFTLFSNGRWLHSHRLISLLRNTPTCDGLLISLHGPKAGIHESFSGVPGSFAETVNNIRLATNAGLEVATSMVINATNFDAIEENLALTLELGANHLVCNRLIAPPTPGLTPDEEQLRHAMHTIEHLRAKGFPIRFGNCIPQCFEPSSSRGCTAGSTFATIDPWGRVRPCNHTPLIAGDLFKEPIEKIWRGEQMNFWRSLIPAECQRCSAYTICHGGCRAQALIKQKRADPLMKAPLAVYLDTEPALHLYAGLRPIALFERPTTMPTAGAQVILLGSKAATISPEVIALAPLLNGSLTLRKIKQDYGQKALDWIGLLYKEGMITWQTVTPMSE